MEALSHFVAAPYEHSMLKNIPKNEHILKFFVYITT